MANAFSPCPPLTSTLCYQSDDSGASVLEGQGTRQTTLSLLLIGSELLGCLISQLARVSF